jgi:hypothetical protein
MKRDHGARPTRTANAGRSKSRKGSPDHTRQPRKRQRRNPLSLARLTKQCRSAGIVWVALVELAESRGGSYVTPTRAQLCELTGIDRERTISEALSALEFAGWIRREHIPVSSQGKRTATLLRIALRKGRKSTQ